MTKPTHRIRIPGDAENVRAAAVIVGDAAAARLLQKGIPMRLLERFQIGHLVPALAVTISGAMDGERRDRETRRQFRVFHGDRDLRELATAYAAALFDDAVARGEVKLAEGDDSQAGWLQRFIKFILDNQEAIIAFIKQIVALFGGAVPATVTAERMAAQSALHMGDNETALWHIQEALRLMQTAA